jgi:hypothetical protein
MTDPGSVRNEGLVRAIGAGALGLGVVNMVVGAGILSCPAKEAISIAALISASVVVYAIRARFRGSWSGTERHL